MLCFRHRIVNLPFASHQAIFFVETTVTMIVKVFTVTRNEYDLIDDFVKYYSRLFGAANVHLIDNDSDDERVLAVYERCRADGVVLDRAPTYEGSGQGDALTAVMKKYKNSCDFMLALDTDEFLCRVDGGGDGGSSVSCEAGDITDVIRGWSDPAHTMFKIAGQRWACVCDPDADGYRDHKLTRPVADAVVFQREPYVRKWFFRAPAFLRTSNGNHRGKVATGVAREVQSLGVIHFHNTGRKRMFERCEQIMKAYKYVRDGTTVEQRIDAIERNAARWTTGGHRVKQYHEFMLVERMLSECRASGLIPPDDPWAFLSSMSRATWSKVKKRIQMFPRGRATPGDADGDGEDYVFRDPPLSSYGPGLLKFDRLSQMALTL